MIFPFGSPHAAVSMQAKYGKTCSFVICAQTVIAASADDNVVELVETRTPFANMVYPAFGNLWDSTRSSGSFP